MRDQESREGVATRMLWKRAFKCKRCGLTMWPGEVDKVTAPVGVRINYKLLDQVFSGAATVKVKKLKLP